MPSSWHCIQHDREVAYELQPIGSHQITVRGDCPDCVKETRETGTSIRNRKLEEDTILLRRRAGVPERYLQASLKEFREETMEQQQVAQRLREFVGGGWQQSPGLLFTGTVGTAKTFLGSALTNHWLDHYGSQSARFCTMLGLMRRIKAAWDPDSVETETILLRRLNELPILVIDEIGVQFGSKAESVLFTDIINERYNFLRPTILITNLTTQECHKELGDRVMDRLRDGGHALAFTWPSQRGRTPS